MVAANTQSGVSVTNEGMGYGGSKGVLRQRLETRVWREQESVETETRD